MSAVGILIDDTSAKTDTSPEAVRLILSLGVRHIPEGTKIDGKSMASALEATRREVNGPVPPHSPVGTQEDFNAIIDHLETELSSMGRVKSALVFGAIRAGIGELREELRS